MKKFLSLILVLTSLLMITGCGKKTTAVDDSESLYPSNYATEKKDNRLVINIEGDWDKDCQWRAEYNQEFLTCEEGKDGKSFIFGSLGFGDDEINLRLCRDGAEDWEYTLWYYVQSDGLGGLRILAATHIEPTNEGSYTSEQDADGNLLFRINTTHQWDCRTLSGDVEVDLSECGEDYCTFFVKTASEEQGEVELLDKEGARMLTLTVCKETGATRLKDVVSSDTTTLGQKNLDYFWEELGFSLPIPADVQVEDASIRTDDDHVFPCGDMELTIHGEAFTYSVSLEESWMEEYHPDTVGEPDINEGPAPSTEEQVEIGTVNVTIFTQGKQSMAIWKQYDVAFGMDGVCTQDTMIEALHVLLEG